MGMADATGLPGGIVTQKEAQDCFSASISMLTGIDLELLPVLPPAFIFTKHNNMAAHKVLWGDHPHFDADPETFICLDDTTLPWVDLLRENGFVLSISLTQPHKPAIAMMKVLDWPQGHATVHFPNGTFVNTDTGAIEDRGMDRGINYEVFAWWVVTPL